MFKFGRDLKTLLLFFTSVLMAEFCNEYFFLLLFGHSMSKARMLFLDKSEVTVEPEPRSIFGVSQRSSTWTSAFWIEEALLLQHFAYKTNCWSINQNNWLCQYDCLSNSMMYRLRVLLVVKLT